MTTLTCPSCGGEMSLDVLIAHNELRQAAFSLVEKSLSLGSLVLRYIALFRPAKNRMSADRWAKLIMQLLPDLDRQAITHRGRDWPMPIESWRLGLEAMLEKAAVGKLQLPLENHNYLYTVLAGMADKLEAAQEEQVERDRRARSSTSTESASMSDVVADMDNAITQVRESVGHLKPEPKRGVPEHIREQLHALKHGTSTKEVSR